MKFTVDYFINKFKGIPSKKWIVGQFSDRKGRHCALGHCGVRKARNTTVEGDELIYLFSGSGYDVASINDHPSPNFSQSGPRHRILAALRAIKRRLRDEEHRLEEPV